MSNRIDIQPGAISWPKVSPVFADVWPPDVQSTLPWRDIVFAHAERRIVTCDEQDISVGHVGLYVRSMLWNADPVRVGGIGGVATIRRHQGRGVASRAMQIAAVTFAGEQLDFGLLFCAPDKFSFYESLAWHRFDGDAFIDQPAGRTTFDATTPFVLDLRASPRTGTFDLCGLPW